MKRALLGLSLLLIATLACSVLVPAAPTETIPPTQPPTQPAPTTESPTVAPDTAVPPTQAAVPQFLAYISPDAQLLVTDLTGGVVGGTTQYTMPQQNDGVWDIQWSPSGEFIAYAGTVAGIERLYYIYAQGASTPTDLGPGTYPAWSPDSKQIVYVGGAYPDENIFITSIDNPAPRQLTQLTGHAWGRPAFTPDGQSLIVATADRMNMGAQGNTSFALQNLALDGSGTLTPVPGSATVDGMRLPYDLHFSPDGSHIAFSTSGHLSACAAPSSYYIADATGANLRPLGSPSLQAAADNSQDRYYEGLSYGWTRGSDALIAAGIVVDCNYNSPNMGKPVAGPQMALLHLNGSESLVIPGEFYSPSMDRSGTLIAAALYIDIQDKEPKIQLYSAQTGQLLTTVATGRNPVFQP